MHRIADRSRAQQGDGQRAARQALQGGGQFKQRPLAPGQIGAQGGALLAQQANLGLGSGDPGFGFLNAGGNRGGLPRGAFGGGTGLCGIGLQPFGAGAGGNRGALRLGRASG